VRRYSVASAICQIAREVSEMRAKMRDNLGSRPRPAGANAFKATSFDLKQDAGGIVDIEFMVQYAARRVAPTPATAVHRQYPHPRWPGAGCCCRRRRLLQEVYKAYRGCPWPRCRSSRARAEQFAEEGALMRV
jgi:glutamate-ammonia-ligase adenylyltransferase